MDSSSILQSVGAAAVGGIGSLITALRSAAKHYKELKEEVDELQEKHKKLSSDVVLNSAVTEFKRQTIEDLKRALFGMVEEIRRDLDGKVEGLKRGFRFELDSHKDDLERRVRDFDRTTKPELTPSDDVRRRLDTIEGRVDRLRDDHGAFVRAQTFSDYTEEQARQWNEINRMLGQIMGALKK